MCSSTDSPKAAVPDTGLHIRPMAAFDAGRVAQLESMCFPCGWDAGQYKEALEGGTLFGTVCQDDAGDTIGYVAASGVLDEMEILNVAVREDKRRLGVASALLDAALQEACERHILICHLEVRTGNVPARTLYEHAGFRQAGLRRKYYADNGEDALIMTLDLRDRQTEQRTASAPEPHDLQETL